MVDNVSRNKDRLQTTIVAVSAVVFVACTLFLIFRDAVPGTFHRDERGFPHGTGQGKFYYEDGSLMIREWYFRGLLYKATWYEPDGSEIATETYSKSDGGVGYFLRQDGTIKSRYEFVYSPEDKLYVSDSPPLYYDLSGKPIPSATEPIE